MKLNLGVDTTCNMQYRYVNYRALVTEKFVNINLKD